MMPMSGRSSISGLAASMLLAAFFVAGAPQPATAAAEVAAKVNGEVITVEEWESTFARVARQKLYHADVAPERAAALRRETLDTLIDERLLVAEATRRKIGPDTAAVEQQLAGYDEQYKNSPEWERMRAEVLPQLRDHLLKDSVRQQLEKKVKDVPVPPEAELKAYYDKNREAFTEPRRERVSVILLKVDPSADTAQWKAAGAEAQRIVDRARGGADFAELARLHSGDGSAAQGGDMGYLHRGMLAEDAQEVLDKMNPGQVSDPVRLLQGYAVFKLVSRTEPVVHGLDRVRDRAVQLYQRERGDQRWADLIKNLRKAAKIEVLVSLPPQQGSSAAR